MKHSLTVLLIATCLFSELCLCLASQKLVPGCNGLFCDSSNATHPLDQDELQYLADHFAHANKNNDPHPLLGQYIQYIASETPAPSSDTTPKGSSSPVLSRIQRQLADKTTLPLATKSPGNTTTAPATNILSEVLPLATDPLSSARTAQLAGPYAGLTIPFHPDLDFVVMIDAGSQGSRVHIMGFTHRAGATGRSPWSTVFTHHSWSASVRPGISSFVNAPEQVSAAVQPLVDWAVARLVHYRARFTHIPLFLKATAGMRVIRSVRQRMHYREDALVFVYPYRFAHVFFAHTRSYHVPLYSSQFAIES